MLSLFDNLFILVSALIGWYSTSGKKSQFVRLFDIFVYGPALILIGKVIKNNQTFNTPLIIAYFLFFLGTTTITYNLRNYLEYKKKML